MDISPGYRLQALHPVALSTSSFLPLPRGGPSHSLYRYAFQESPVLHALAISLTKRRVYTFTSFVTVTAPGFDSFELAQQMHVTQWHGQSYRRWSTCSRCPRGCIRVTRVSLPAHIRYVRHIVQVYSYGPLHHKLSYAHVHTITNDMSLQSGTVRGATMLGPPS